MNIITSVTNAYGASRYDPVGKRVQRSASDSAGSTAPRGADAIEISSSSIEFGKMIEKAKEAPEVRIEVVEKIKARIKINDYPIENSFNEALRSLVDNKLL